MKYILRVFSKINYKYLLRYFAINLCSLDAKWKTDHATCKARKVFVELNVAHKGLKVLTTGMLQNVHNGYMYCVRLLIAATFHISHVLQVEFSKGNYENDEYVEYDILIKTRNKLTKCLVAVSGPCFERN